MCCVVCAACSGRGWKDHIIIAASTQVKLSRMKCAMLRPSDNLSQSFSLYGFQTFWRKSHRALNGRRHF